MVSDVLQLFGMMSSMNGGSDSKESARNAEDQGLIPGLERYSGEGNGYPLQYSCLENSMNKELGGLQSMGSQRVTHTEHFHYFTSSDLLFVK